MHTKQEEKANWKHVDCMMKSVGPTATATRTHSCTVQSCMKVTRLGNWHTRLPGTVVVHREAQQHQKQQGYLHCYTAKAIVISNVIDQSDITSNPKAVAKAGVIWSRILTKFGSEYQAALYNALGALEGSEGMEGAMDEDE